MLAIRSSLQFHQLAFCSQSCVFVGYSKNHLGYKCLHIPSGRVYIARHVVFNEQIFPFSKSVTIRSPTPLIPSAVSVPLIIPSTNHINDTCSSPPENSHHTLPNYSPQSLIPFNSPTTSSSAAPTDTSHTHALVPLEQPPPSRVHDMITRSQNQIFKPTKFKDG